MGEYYFQIDARYTQLQYNRMFQRYSIRRDKILGKGDYAIVYEAQNDARDKFAAKVYTKEGKTKNMLERIHREAEILLNIESKYIVKSYRFDETDKQTIIIMEKCDKDLYHAILDKKENVGLTIPIIFGLFKTICLCLLAIVEKSIIHRSLNPRKLLLLNGVVKVTDFFGARYINKMGRTYKEKNPYVSPQIILGEEYTSKTDIWSVGVIFYEICCGKLPFGQYDDKYIERCLTNKVQFPSKISPEIQDIIIRCLQFSEENRLDIDGLVNLIMLSKIKDPVLDKELSNLFLRVFSTNQGYMQGSITFKDEPETEEQKKCSKIVMDLSKHSEQDLRIIFQANLRAHEIPEMTPESFHHFIKFICSKDTYDQEAVNQLIDRIDIDRNGFISFEQLMASFNLYKPDFLNQIHSEVCAILKPKQKKFGKLFYAQFQGEEEQNMDFQTFSKMILGLEKEAKRIKLMKEDDKRKVFDSIKKGKNEISVDDLKKFYDKYK